MATLPLSSSTGCCLFLKLSSIYHFKHKPASASACSLSCLLEHPNEEKTRHTNISTYHISLASPPTLTDQASTSIRPSDSLHPNSLTRPHSLQLHSPSSTFFSLSAFSSLPSPSSLPIPSPLSAASLRQVSPQPLLSYSSSSSSPSLHTAALRHTGSLAKRVPGFTNSHFPRPQTLDGRPVPFFPSPTLSSSSIVPLPPHQNHSGQPATTKQPHSSRSLLWSHRSLHRCLRPSSRPLAPLRCPTARPVSGSRAG